MSHGLFSRSHSGSHRRAGFWLAWGIACLAAPVPLLRAQLDPVTGEPPTMLLLQSGKIAAGRLTYGVGGYTLVQSSGNLFIPHDQIQLACSDVTQAYKHLRGQMPEQKTANHHVVLARWCLTYQLFEQARDELQDAAALEPNRKEIRLLLRRAESLLEGSPETMAASSTSDTPRKKSLLENDPVRLESLGGLPREAAEKFPLRIQPILVNNCATAGCHGPKAKSEFQLTIVRSGQRTNRQLVEKNLAAVLQYVDRQQPHRSELLTVLAGNHGKQGKTLFAGPHGREQLKELRDWVQQLAPTAAADNSAFAGATHLPPVPVNAASARESAKPATQMADPFALTPAANTQSPSRARRPTASQTAATPIASPPQQLPPKTPDSPAPVQTAALEEPEPSASSEVERPVRVIRGDPFDPEVFNRETRRKQRGL